MNTFATGIIDESDEAMQFLRENLQSASEQVMLTLPASVLPSIADDLVQARENGALITALFYGDEATVRAAAARDLEEIASAVRYWDVEWGFTLFVVDRKDGMMVPNRLLTEQDPPVDGVVFSDERIYHLARGWFVAHPWEGGIECATRPPDPLPATFDDVVQATFQATLWLRQDRDIRLTASAKPAGSEEAFRQVSGQVVSTRQQYLYPKLSSFFGETAIIARCDGDRVSFGGLDAYVEDYEADSVTLHTADR